MVRGLGLSTTSERTAQPPSDLAVDQDVDLVAVLVDGAPEILTSALNVHEQFVQIPGVAQSPAAMSDMPGYPNFVAAFQHNVPRFEIPPEKVVTHQMKSEQIPLGQASSFLGGSVRLISLDGDHRRASIVHDLRLSKEVLSDFGVVIVDDILSAWAPSVTEGIIDFLRQDAGDLVPFALAASDGPLTTGCAKVFLCKKSARSFYTEYLRRLNLRNLKMTTDFCDHSILVFDFEEGVKKTQLSA